VFFPANSVDPEKVRVNGLIDQIWSVFDRF
jgi:hypothetical protein